MRNFAAIPVKPYIGQLFGTPIPFCGGSIPARIVPLNINWTAYGASSAVPNLGVAVELNDQAPAPLIDKIVSVYIDNTDSLSPIFVLFPDTNFIAVCQPNSTLWLPVLTKIKRCFIYATNMATGAVPQTLVYLCDTYVSGFSDIERLTTFPLFRSSEQITSQNIFTAGYGAPALGDQQAGLSYNLNQVTTTAPVVINVGTLIPYTTPGKICVLTHIVISGFGLYAQGVNMYADFQVYLSNGVQTWFNSTARVRNFSSTNTTDNFDLIHLQGCNIQLNHIANISAFLVYSSNASGDFYGGRFQYNVVYTIYDPLT